MKYAAFISMLILQYQALMAQPTGNSGIYFALYEVVKGDTLTVPHSFADSAFDRTKAFKMGDYSISDGGSKQYGFEKHSYQPFACKTIFWHEENILVITRNRRDVMTIRFVNLPVSYYFLNIHFQKGDYTLAVPGGPPNDDLQHLPQKRVGDKLYGYDITPRNWAAHRLMPGEKPTAAHSIIPAVKPPIPYAAEWTGTCTRRMRNGQAATEFAVYCWMYHGKVVLTQREAGANNMTWWEGDVITGTDSSYSFQFYSGYFWGVGKDPDTVFGTRHYGCNIIAGQHTAPMLRAVQVSGKGMYGKIYPLRNAGCDDECLLQTDTIARPPAAKIMLLYNENGSNAVTQQVDLPEDGKPLRFHTLNWKEPDKQPVMRFRLSKGQLVLQDDERNPVQEALTLQLRTQ